jgi:hypothetical protein
LICVVSAVSRESTSPVCALSKNAGESRVRMTDTSLRKVGDNALAERGDEVEAHAARGRRARRPTAIITVK